MTNVTEETSTPTKSPSISVLDKNKTNGLVASFNETLKLQFSEHKAGIRSTLKELVAYEKIQNQNLHQWKDLQGQQEKEQARLAKYEQVVSANSMMDIDLDAHGL